jgi:hypothetical protein
MAEKEDQIYRNLEYVSKAYFAVEGIYPFWESAFALIVGQIFIAYFTSQACNDQKIGLVWLGLFLSFLWLILVSLNLQYANHIDTKMQKLRDCLRRCDPPPSFIWPWREKEDGSSLGNTLYSLVIGKKEEETTRQALANLPWSTWFYRRFLPFVLVCFWGQLLYKYFVTIFVIILLVLMFICYKKKSKSTKKNPDSSIPTKGCQLFM